MSQSIINEATRAILTADLTPVEHRLLVDFVEQATDPVLAAHEILDRIRCSTDHPVEETLRVFKNHWHRLVARGKSSLSLDADIS